MYKAQPKKPIPFMDRRVPKGDRKYDGVSSRVNSGLTVDKVKFATSNELARRKNEIFYRISPKQLQELYIEYEAEERESIVDMEGQDCSHGPRIVTYSEFSQPDNSKPYLIYDVREPSEFQSCHLLQARSFPYTHMRRDIIHPELYRFKNKEEALIIVYCDDERVSKDAAKLLVDRGADNIFLLNGGLFEFALKHPEFMEGRIPKEASPPKRGTAGARHLQTIAEESVLSPSQAAPYYTSPQSNRRSGGLSRSPSAKEHELTRSNLNRHNRGGRGDSDNRSESGYSVRSNMSVAESVISRAMSRKGKF